MNRLFLLSFIAIVLHLSSLPVAAQTGDLMDQLKAEEEEEIIYTTATFRSNRVVNNHSVENLPEGILDFRISHRFGSLSGGAYNLFGMDDAMVRLIFDYAITDRMMAGISRSSEGKIYDGYYRINILRQSKGAREMPLTLTYFTNVAYVSERSFIPFEDDGEFWQNRLAYVNQIMVGRRFTEKISFQIMPTLVHKNLVESPQMENTIGALGFGGRFDLFDQSSIIVEYMMLQPGTHMADVRENALSVGLDIETGGHVFQLHLSNARGTSEKSYITETNGSWLDGDIHFGFNISRVFDLK